MIYKPFAFCFWEVWRMRSKESIRARSEEVTAIRLKPGEKAEIRAASRAVGLSMGAFVRYCIYQFFKGGDQDHTG